MIAVAVVADNLLAREGLLALLAGTGQCTGVAVGPDADLGVVRASSPQVILVGLGLNGGGLEVVERMRQGIPAAGVVVLDLMPVHEDIVDLVNAGAAGFVMRDASLEELLSTIVAVAEGQHVLPPEMTKALFTEIARDASGRTGEVVAGGTVRMTAREREVIVLIREGLSNKRIAARLDVAPQTVKSHVRNIMEKLALNTRLQIAAYGRPRGGDPQD
jgi:two-component system, NarL family, nitrate/nitrite response regulator NarL